MIYADQRWIGGHGIGRFARHVLAALHYRPLSLISHPASPLDAWRITRELACLTGEDLFFSPGYSTPVVCNAPFVFTIHDLNHIDRPENSSVLKRLYYVTLLKRACHRAAMILTVSEFSRGRIVEWSGVAPEKVFNVGCGVDAAYYPGVEAYSFAFPYLLCVSNRKRHKNEFRMIEAFAQARIDSEIYLVFTGEATAELAHCISRCGVTQRVRFVGTVADAQMPALYGSAEALVFPSLYEGFGLPILEAMACGTPVVTAETSALPEVAGNAALLVDPTSVGQIAAAIERVVDDRLLRHQLREKGLAQAAKFSWATTAVSVKELLTRVALESVGKGR